MVGIFYTEIIHLRESTMGVPVIQMANNIMYRKVYNYNGTFRFTVAIISDVTELIQFRGS